MYPQAALTGLARDKAARRQSIARHRTQCAEAASTVVRPLGWLDTALRVWRGFAPLTRLAPWHSGAAVARSVFPGGKTVSTVLRWAPAVIGAVSALRRIRTSERSREPVSP